MSMPRWVRGAICRTSQEVAVMAKLAVHRDQD
ncbi:hypothetical protein SAMN05421753_101247 [Planctomicrobium piriforme]|uniref:Uncharacterized protein n=1 Tax=Planctomicrobium piriforme TaxID=1576369 RepID=A0A1I3B5A3_9PLAN|nr:hypothetical protein SAMN05421753_101247 [Planctomicrobium piriforme]